MSGIGGCSAQRYCLRNSDFCILPVPPILSDFMDAHPKVELLMQLTNRHIDLINDFMKPRLKLNEKGSA